MPCLSKQCSLFEDQKLLYFSRLVPDTPISNPQKMKTSLEMKISLLMVTKKCFFIETLFFVLAVISNPSNIYLFKVNIRNMRRRCEICSELTIKTPERRHWRRFGVIIVNWAYFSAFPSISIVASRQVNVCWDKPNMEKWLDPFCTVYILPILEI